MKIMYLIYAEELWQPLIRRQVIEVLESISLKSPSIQIRLVCFYPWYWLLKKKQKIDKFEKEAMSLHYKVSFIPIPFPFPFPAPFFTSIKGVGWRPFGKMNPLMAVFLSFIILPYLFVFYLKGYRVFHCRSYPVSLPTAILSKILSHCKLIFDPRSDYPEENITAGIWKRKSLSFSFWKKIEKFLLKSSASTVCITEGYTKHFSDGGTVFNYEIIPNNVDIDKFIFDVYFRENYRKDKLLGEKLIFGYLGSMSAVGWHRPDIYAEVILKYRDLKIPHTFLFIVPKSSNKIIENIFTEHDILSSEYYIENPKFNDIAKYLSVIDYGLLYLDKKKIALGTKIVEYIAIGIPIIINSNIQGATDLIKQYYCGKIINIGLGDSDSSFDSLPISYFNEPIDRNSIRELAIKLFSLDVVADKYLKLYESL